MVAQIEPTAEAATVLVCMCHSCRCSDHPLSWTWMLPHAPRPRDAHCPISTSSPHKPQPSKLKTNVVSLHDFFFYNVCIYMFSRMSIRTLVANALPALFLVESNKKTVSARLEAGLGGRVPNTARPKKTESTTRNTLHPKSNRNESSGCNGTRYNLASIHVPTPTSLANARHCCLCRWSSVMRMSAQAAMPSASRATSSRVWPA